MRSLLEVYVQQFKTTLASQVQYRAALAIWMISHVLEPVIYLVVWSTVARASGGRVGSFTTGDFVAYFIVLMLVNHATFTWIMFEYDYRIREGLLSPRCSGQCIRSMPILPTTFPPRPSPCRS